MQSVFLLLLGLLLLALFAQGCAPSTGGGGSDSAGITAGMCPKCGGTNFDVQTDTERDAFTGEPTDYLTLTCRDCGHSWRAPASAK